MVACKHAEVLAGKVGSTVQVYKEECTHCFASQVFGWSLVGYPAYCAFKDSEGGVDVCLTCFNGACRKYGHSEAHSRNFSHNVVLNIQRSVRKDYAEKEALGPPPLKKIAIQEEATETEKYEYSTSVKCLSCGDIADISTFQNLSTLVPSVLAATSSQRKSDIQAWEALITDCQHTRELTQGPSKPIEQKSLAHCSDCELKENLWLCLICGNLGCGRQQYGGTGGNSHGIAHFESTSHPVSVKLGTITPEGTADIFCYSCGEERLDPHLGKHLKNFGILVEGQEKTVKSLAEMELEQNIKFDFSMTTEDGKELAPLFGPGLTGLINLGNTCYMASVLQLLFSVPTFQKRYSEEGQKHIAICKDTAAGCFHCQMSKLAHGLLSGAFSIPTESGSGQNGISPGMFKSMMSKGHPEFGTMRQQDAQEYFSHVLKTVEQKERSRGPEKDPSRAFKFAMEQRLQCAGCGNVKYVQEAAVESVLVPVPASENDGDDVIIPFSACIDKLVGEEGGREFRCPNCKKVTELKCSNGFRTFPEILVLPMNRFVQGSGYVIKKLNVRIDAPSSLDLTKFKSNGPQPGEVLLPEDISGSGSANRSFDEEAVSQLMAMGFSEVRCQRALLATGNNGPEIAMNWLFEHIEDPDIDDPIADGSLPASDNDSIDYSMLIDMGFTLAQAKKALKNTGNNMERAVDWLFSHPDDDGSMETGQDISKNELIGSGTGRYELLGFISHRGTSAHCGHYVAHVKKDGRWVIFNDNKVAEVVDVSKAVGEAYIYFYSSV